MTFLGSCGEFEKGVSGKRSALSTENRHVSGKIVS